MASRETLFCFNCGEYHVVSSEDAPVHPECLLPATSCNECGATGHQTRFHGAFNDRIEARRLMGARVLRVGGGDRQPGQPVYPTRQNQPSYEELQREIARLRANMRGRGGYGRSVDNPRRPLGNVGHAIGNREQLVDRPIPYHRAQYHADPHSFEGRRPYDLQAHGHGQLEHRFTTPSDPAHGRITKGGRKPRRGRNSAVPEDRSVDYEGWSRVLHTRGICLPEGWTDLKEFLDQAVRRSCTKEMKVRHNGRAPPFYGQQYRPVGELLSHNINRIVNSLMSTRDRPILRSTPDRGTERLQKHEKTSNEISGADDDDDEDDEVL